MLTELRLLLLGSAIFTCIYFLSQIRKNRLQINYAVFWSFFSLGLVLMSVFPGIVVWISGLLGFESPANLVLLMVIFVLIIRLFSITCNQSLMNHQITELTHYIALQEIKEKQMKEKAMKENEMEENEMEGDNS